MRLIDADVLEEQFGISDEDIIAKEIIGNAPTVDAVPVVHGEWLVKCTAAGRKYTQCNKCRLALSFRDDKNRFHTLDMSRFDYCPNCGAKMDGGAPCE